MLAQIIEDLRVLYGEPNGPPTRDIFELVLLESVAYLTDDRKRAAAFDGLRAAIGTSPEAIAEAPDEALRAITRSGVLPDMQMEKLRRIATIGVVPDLSAVQDLPLQQARKALPKFPGVGEPVADKILLLSQTQPVFAVDSNGLRVLLRLGYGVEERDYRRSYRSAMEAIRPELRDGFEWLIAAHLLLRQHGQLTCRRSQPMCERCPLTGVCAYYKSRS